MLPASIPSPDPVWSQIHLGPLTIHTYALCLLAGIAAAAWITDRRLRARGATPGLALDIAMWAVPIGIVGARIYHVLTHLGDFTGPGVDPWAWVRIWEGGNALFGSLLGGAVGVWIGCRISGLRFWSFADALAPGLLVAQAIGRLGNYVNQELFGLPTTLPWGLEIRSDAAMFPAGTPEGTLFHPLFLYEMIWNLVGVALLLTIERRVTRRNEALATPGPGLRWGRLFGLYLVWYGLGRSWLEAIRIDPTSDAPLGIPANIWTSGIAVLLGIAIVVVQGRRHTEPELSVYVPGREPAEDEDEDAEGTTPTAAAATDLADDADPAADAKNDADPAAGAEAADGDSAGVEAAGRSGDPDASPVDPAGRA